MDVLQGVDELSVPMIKDEIRKLPSSEEIISSKDWEDLESLRVKVQDIQNRIDTSRGTRTKSYAIRNMVNKSLPPQRPPILAKNWYQTYKHSA
jgi:hypothetical protein